MNDKERIENAIIPSLLTWMIELILKGQPEQKNAYQKALEILKRAENEYLDIAPVKKKEALQRRFKRLCVKLEQYYIDSKFDTRKGMIMLTAWAFALAKEDALAPMSEEYGELLWELDGTFNVGFDEIAGFDKIFNSATKHVPKVHAITQQMGYL